jgi:hypothetical protein
VLHQEPVKSPVDAVPGAIVAEHGLPDRARKETEWYFGLCCIPRLVSQSMSATTQHWHPAKQPQNKQF